MMVWISLLNFAAVGLFGTILAASFCDIAWTPREKKIFSANIVLLGCLQGLLFVTVGAVNLRLSYPLITHLPLALLLGYLSRKYLWSIFAVFTAYLCCQLRRWIPLLFVSLLHGDALVQEILELLITVPLLLLIVRFASPAVRNLSQYPISMQIQFGLIPMIGYVFDYLTRVYTDWLVMGVPAATEFLLFMCALAQLIFARHSNDVLRQQRNQEQLRLVLDLQNRQATRQIAEMKKSQDLTAAYRHDLRHHLQYLSDCIANGTLTEAQNYINNLNSEISRQTIHTYCDNIPANLVLSHFASRASAEGIRASFRVHLSRFLSVSDNDLCILLSNALENALNACISLQSTSPETFIDVRCYEKDRKIFLEIINSCTDNIRFENHLPVTDRPGHGIGVRSICSIVDKYGGIYTFETTNSKFILRLSL